MIMGSTLARLNTIRFFAWGFIKSLVYTGRIIIDVTELKNCIWDVVQTITPQMLKGVFWEASYHFELCRDIDERHIET